MSIDRGVNIETERLAVYETDDGVRLEFYARTGGFVAVHLADSHIRELARILSTTRACEPTKAGGA